VGALLRSGVEGLMPSTSAKQARFMQAVAHDPKFAKKAGVPQKVGKEFASADERKAHAQTLAKALKR
jgi:hypothetical protein